MRVRIQSPFDRNRVLKRQTVDYPCTIVYCPTPTGLREALPIGGAPRMSVNLGASVPLLLKVALGGWVPSLAALH